MAPVRPVSPAQVAVFIEHAGNADMYERRRLNDPRMFEDAWYTIGNLLQRLTLVALQPTSDAYRAELERDLMAWTCDEETRTLIRKLSVGAAGK